MSQSLPGRWSVPLLLLLLTGCASSSLQLLQEPPPYLSELRSEYFTANPDSPYRSDVTGSTIVPGMERFDVLASWGHPARRLDDAGGYEAWTYYDVDVNSGDAMEYDLLFKQGVLDRWSSRSYKNIGLGYRPVTNVQDQVSTAEPPPGKRVPQN